jgi:hypothetical protein
MISQELENKFQELTSQIIEGNKNLHISELDELIEKQDCNYDIINYLYNKNAKVFGKLYWYFYLHFC